MNLQRPGRLQLASDVIIGFTGSVSGLTERLCLLLLLCILAQPYNADVV